MKSLWQASIKEYGLGNGLLISRRATPDITKTYKELVTTAHSFL